MKRRRVGLQELLLLATTTTNLTTAAILSLLMTSSVVVAAASNNATVEWRTSLELHESATVHNGGAGLVNSTSALPVTDTSLAVTRRHIYIRGHRVQHGDTREPETEVSERESTPSRLSRFHRINAAQSSSLAGDGGAAFNRRHSVGPSVTTRLLYGAIALVVASVVTPVVCLLVAAVRTRVNQCLERRRRYDKSGEYERVDSVSSVVDSSLYSTGAGASQSQLDLYYTDEPITIEDVTII